jgi:hypothetical protein
MDISSPETENQIFSRVLIGLLKGVRYRQEDEKGWADLIRLQTRVREYMKQIGLELILDDAEGYAFLRSMDLNEEETDLPPLPRLIARRQLSFPVSLILALLRKKLVEFDAGGTDTRLILPLSEITETVRVFLPESSNETRILDQIETHLNKIIDLGFLRKLKQSSPPAYEVLRILQAFVDAQWLADFDARLAAYQQKLSGEDSEEDEA